MTSQSKPVRIAFLAMCASLVFCDTSNGQLLRGGHRGRVRTSFVQVFPAQPAPFFAPLATPTILPGVGVVPTVFQPVPVPVIVQREQPRILIDFRNRTPSRQQAPVSRPPAHPKANLHVFVLEADVEVFIDGKKVEGEGVSRKILVPELPTNKSNEVEVEIRWTEDGRPLRRKKKVIVSSRTTALVDFTQPMK